MPPNHRNGSVSSGHLLPTIAKRNVIAVSEHCKNRTAPALGANGKADAISTDPATKRPHGSGGAFLSF